MSDTAILPPALGGNDHWLVSMAKADLHVHLLGSAAGQRVYRGWLGVLPMSASGSAAGEAEDLAELVLDGG